MTQLQFADQFHTDQFITNEELTPEVLEEIGKHKFDIIAAVSPHWQAITGYDDIGDVTSDVLALELEPMTPDFIRALAMALKAR
jgi:hypothetical protein